MRFARQLRHDLAFGFWVVSAKHASPALDGRQLELRTEPQFGAGPRGDCAHARARDFDVPYAPADFAFASPTALDQQAVAARDAHTTAPRPTAGDSPRTRNLDPNPASNSGWRVAGWPENPRSARRPAPG